MADGRDAERRRAMLRKRRVVRRLVRTVARGRVIESEVFIETDPDDWEATLAAHDRGEGPAPLPRGHCIFDRPQDYQAELLEPVFREEARHA